MPNILLTLPNGHKTNIDNPRDVYRAIGRWFSPDLTKLTSEQHMIAANAEGWCELASSGETYRSDKLPGLEITML